MWLFIGIIIGLIIISIILLYYYKKIKCEKISSNEKENTILKQNISNYFPTVQIIEDNKIIPSEKNKITDSNIKKAIVTIDNMLPKSAIISNNIKNGTELLNSNRAFFSAAKKGTENMQSVGNTGKVYGSQMKKDALTNRKLYSKQTEFTREDALVKSANRIEILNNEILTKKRYDEIIDLEKECKILLGQANDEIRKNIPNDDIEYNKYEKILKIISKWFARQQLLQRLLLEIGDLRYVLACGNETPEHSHAQYNIYLEQTNFVNEQLKNLHTKMSEKFGIDINKSRKNGKFYDFRKNTVGKIKEDWAYHKLDNNTVNMIKSQINTKKLMPYIKEKQDEVIKIQKYNGEYYNLLEE